MRKKEVGNFCIKVCLIAPLQNTCEIYVVVYMSSVIRVMRGTNETLERDTISWACRVTMQIDVTTVHFSVAGLYSITHIVGKKHSLLLLKAIRCRTSNC